MVAVTFHRQTISWVAKVEALAQQYTAGGPADWKLIPQRMRGAMHRYLQHGIAPGHFLTAVLSNDLREAVSRADEENMLILHDYIRFLYNYAPNGSWGSKQCFDNWLAIGGLDGLIVAHEKQGA
jgi:hypothetical protein